MCNSCVCCTSVCPLPPAFIDRNAVHGDIKPPGAEESAGSLCFAERDNEILCWCEEGEPSIFQTSCAISFASKFQEGTAFRITTIL